MVLNFLLYALFWSLLVIIYYFVNIKIEPKRFITFNGADYTYSTTPF